MFEGGERHLSTKTKYSNHGIAALCGVAVLFIGETVPLYVSAEQAEQDIPEIVTVNMEEPAEDVFFDEKIPEDSVQSGELSGTAGMPLPESEPEPGEIPTETLTETESQGEAVPESGQPETPSETETKPSEASADSEAGRQPFPAENEAVQPEAPEETEARQTKDPAVGESETVKPQPQTEGSNSQPERPAETETKQTEVKPAPQPGLVSPPAPQPELVPPPAPQPETVPVQAPAGTVKPETEPAPGSNDTARTEESSETEDEWFSEYSQTEFFSEYDETETETEMIGIDTSICGTDLYGDGSWDYGSYGGSTWWDPSWYITSKYRFRQVDKVILTAGGEAVDVMEEAKADSDEVGRIPQFGVAYLLQEEKNGWLYIESGEVRGFVQAGSLKKEKEEGGLAEIVGDENLATAKALCEKSDNDAYTHTLTTVQDVTVPKEYAVLIRPEDIHEYADERSRVVGKGQSGALVCVLETSEDGWDFVESGNVRGFIPPENLVAGENAEKMVENTGETTFFGISQELDPEENRSFYYTLTSTQTAADELGQEIADYAASFVGRLGYVWGGNDLSGGTDCSGFVQAVYASYGVSLPRLAQEQGCCGQEVRNLEDARAGDVVYWGGGPHVGIYLGDGKVVECHGNESNTLQNPGPGPTIRNVGYMEITSIRRYLIEAPDMQGTGGNRTDPTPYSTKQLELIWAIVAQEDNGSYEGALAVISSAMNRTESPKWGYEGGNALSQLTAAGQYCYSNDSCWIPRLDGNVPAYVKQAVHDCLNSGIRNHTHTSFRSTRGKVTGDDAVQVGGNWYFDS